MGRDFDERVGGIAALEHPVSRRVYRHVAEQRDAVGRDEVAARLDLSRSVAAFHLEKLVEAGLLDAEFRRRSRRAGPGAGRPAKLYRRSSGELAVSVPERHYDLAADVLARAITRAADENLPITEAVQRAAFDVGKELRPPARDDTPGHDAPGDGTPGHDAPGDAIPHRDTPGDATSGRDRPSRDRPAAAVALLEEIGYEPRPEEGDIVLDNCPFHALVDEHRDLVCTMNLHLLTGVVTGLGTEGLVPRLEPEPGQCCVKLDTGRSQGK